jgi:5'-deoxynucleotidase YfbR-like HD superfamily hydrolase
MDMSSSMDLFEKISSFVETHLRETGHTDVSVAMGPQYVFEHSLRVAFWCWRLALEMHADVSTCVAAGLFHDVSYFESGVSSEETARNFMEKETFKREFIDAVAYAIENRTQRGKPKTMETKILEDANKLDEFGCLRLLLFARSMPDSFAQLEADANSLLAEIEKLEKGEKGGTWTSMAKARMQTQITLYKNFLKGLLEEIENTRITMG